MIETVSESSISD